MAPMAFLLRLLPLSWRWSFSLLVIFLSIFASLKTPTSLEHMTNFKHLNLHLMKLLGLSYLNDNVNIRNKVHFFRLYIKLPKPIFFWGVPKPIYSFCWVHLHKITTTVDDIESKDSIWQIWNITPIAEYINPSIQCFHLTGVFCCTSLFQQTKKIYPQFIQIGLHGFSWVHIVWLPKINGEKKRHPFVATQSCSTGPILGERRTIFSFLPQSWFRGTWSYCKGNNPWGNPFPTSRIMGERVIRLILFSQNQGEVSFWFADDTS